MEIHFTLSLKNLCVTPTLTDCKLYKKNWKRKKNLKKGKCKIKIKSTKERMGDKKKRERI